MCGFEHEDVIYQTDSRLDDLIDDVYNPKETQKKHGYPIRIIPNIQHGRILAQSSRFTLHMPDSKSLEKYFYKLLILADDKESILKELSMLNINWDTLYPDLDHLVKELKWQTNTLF